MIVHNAHASELEDALKAKDEAYAAAQKKQTLALMGSKESHASELGELTDALEAKDVEMHAEYEALETRLQTEESSAKGEMATAYTEMVCRPRLTPRPIIGHLPNIPCPVCVLAMCTH